MVRKGGVNVEKIFKPSQNFKKKFMLWVTLGEFTIALLLLKSFVQNYHLYVALILIAVLVIAIVAFNSFISKKIEAEYILMNENHLEYNHEVFPWNEIQEIRIKKEDDRPMFLIIRVEDDYIKIPLRLFQSELELIIQKIKELGRKIVE